MSKGKSKSLEEIVRVFDDAAKKLAKSVSGKAAIQPLRFYLTKREIEIYHKAVPDRMKKVKGKWRLDGVEVVTIGKLKIEPTKGKARK